MSQIKFKGISDVGNKRKVNEDSYWPPKVTRHPKADSPYGQLFIVADGMGGHGSGNVASGITVDIVPRVYYNPNNTQTDIGQRLRQAIIAAHQEIKAKSNTPETAKMGTTIVTVVVQGDKMYVAWVGDSRAYILRNGRLQMVTDDHAVLWPQVKKGLISWEELHYHPQRSKLNNSMTAQREQITVDVRTKELNKGDQILLCSDGLSSEIQDKEIEKILAKNPLDKSVPLLIGAAKAKKTWLRDGKKVSSMGGEDNVTSILIEMPGGKPRAAAVGGASSNMWIIGGIIGLLVLLAVIGGLFLFGGDDTPSESANVTPTIEEPGNGGSSVSLTQNDTPTPVPDDTQPSEEAVVVVEPEETATPTETLVAGETRQPTSTMAATSTPKPTDTPTTTPTLAATNTSQATAVVATNTTVAALTATHTPSNSSGTCKALPGEITLSAPNDGHGVNGEDPVTFEWEWSGSDLPNGYAFEVAIYNGGGLYSAEETGNGRSISGVKLSDKPHVKQGNNEWTVRIVCLESVFGTYKQTGRQAEPPRMINYQSAGGGDDGGGSDDGGGDDGGGGDGCLGGDC